MRTPSTSTALLDPAQPSVDREARALPPLWGARAAHAPLLVTAGLMALMGLVSAVLLVLDPRELLGAPLWAKPLKFSISFVLYTLTLAWLVAMLPPRRTVWWSATVVCVGSVVEMVAIVGMAGLGERSHFDMSTPLHQLVWITMGVAVVVIWLMTLMLAVLLLGTRLDDPAQRLAVRAGLVVGLLGLALGFLMTIPTPGQVAGDVDVVGAHAVGVADGGPGLWLLGWSTEGGDLRVPHFLGMHALQLFPAAVVAMELLARVVPPLRAPGLRRRLLRAVVLGWSGVIALATWQALRGQPVVAPDRWTLLASGLLALVVLTLVVLTLVVGALRPGRRRTSAATP